MADGWIWYYRVITVDRSGKMSAFSPAMVQYGVMTHYPVSISLEILEKEHLCLDDGKHRSSNISRQVYFERIAPYTALWAVR